MNSTQVNLAIKEVGDLTKPGMTASGQGNYDVSCLGPELGDGHRRIQDPEGLNFTLKQISIKSFISNFEVQKNS